MVDSTFLSIKQIRRALYMSSKQLATKLGKAPSTLSELESREVTGNITIQSLEEIAKCLECDFHYEFKPKIPVPDQLLVQAIKDVKDELGEEHHQYSYDALKEDAIKLIEESTSLNW